MSVRLRPGHCGARMGPALPGWQPLTCVQSPEKNRQGARGRQRPLKRLTSLLVQKPSLPWPEPQGSTCCGDSPAWGWEPWGLWRRAARPAWGRGAPVGLLHCVPRSGLAGRAAVLPAAGLTRRVPACHHSRGLQLPVPEARAPVALPASPGLACSREASPFAVPPRAPLHWLGRGVSDQLWPLGARVGRSRASPRDGSTQNLWSGHGVKEWPSGLRLGMEPEPERQIPPVLHKKCDPGQVSFPCFQFSHLKSVLGAPGGGEEPRQHPAGRRGEGVWPPAAWVSSWAVAEVASGLPLSLLLDRVTVPPQVCLGTGRLFV